MGAKRFGRWLYNRLVIRRGYQDTGFRGLTLRFRVSEPSEVSRIDSIVEEAVFIDRMCAAVRPDDIFFDIGGNIGVVSLCVAGESGARVHAFEPEPRNATRLKDNAALNGLERRIEVHELAIGTGKGVAKLFVAGKEGCGLHSLVNSREGSIPITVPVLALDDAANEIGVLPNVVKVDVEGAEFEVLKGMQDLLRRGAVRDLFLEFHPGILREIGVDPASISNLLIRLGYASIWEKQRGGEIHVHYQKADSTTPDNGYFPSNTPESGRSG